jgi:hypothetical protein
LLVGALGCGGGSGNHKVDNNVMVPADAGTGMTMCIDMDGDGYGVGCDLGADCDDNDPSITDQCTRCETPNKGCPCTPGTMYMNCDPADKHITQNGVPGVLVCSQGTRYCRDGAWSDCEIIYQYATFVPDK